MPPSLDASVAASAITLAGDTREHDAHRICTSQEWRRRRTETADLCSVMRSRARIDVRT
jgi:hypothetical protein